jgi:hypothetical protein
VTDAAFETDSYQQFSEGYFLCIGSAMINVDDAAQYLVTFDFARSGWFRTRNRRLLV